VTEVRTLLLQAALGGPALAGLLWLVLSPLRGRWIRGATAGMVGVGANAAAWGVFWLAFRGESPAWRAFEPTLLGSTVAAAAGVAALLAALRADELGRGGSAVAVAGLGASLTAVVATAYATSVAVQVLVLPIPTIAAIVASAAEGRPIARPGLIGLAAADVTAAIGFALAQARSDATALGASEGAAALLLLAAGAAKAGAVPWIGTWRLSGHVGPGGVASVAVRGHGVALAVLGGLILGRGEPDVAVAASAAALVVLAGTAAVAASTEGGRFAGVTGTAAGLPFLALGLGGAVGVRAFLLLFPPFLLGVGALTLVAWRAPPASPRDRARWRGLEVAAVGVAAGSLLGLPLGAGFPGTWLALSLAGARGEVSPWWLLALGAASLGLGLAAMASIPLIRAARPGRWLAAVGALVAVALLYMGTQPVRLGVGWWLRVEAELGTPVVLPGVGVPELPPVGGRNLLAVTAAALLVVALVVLLARGVNNRTHRGVPRGAVDPKRASARPGPRLLPAAAARLEAGARRRGVDLGLALLLEAGAVVLAGLVVWTAARAGFL
jgi:hypothetical protein